MQVLYRFVAPQAHFVVCTSLDFRVSGVRRRSLWSLSLGFVRPSHTIALRIGIRHDMELIRGEIPVGYLPFLFFRSKIGGELADRHSKWGSCWV